MVDDAATVTVAPIGFGGLGKYVLVWSAPEALRGADGLTLGERRTEDDDAAPA